MTKHSPGPWVLNMDEPVPDLAVGGGWYIEDAYGFVALVFGEHNIPEYKANARLIAAAPDLLAALRDMVRFVGTDAGRVLSMIPEDTWYAAHHAIAKATD